MINNEEWEAKMRSVAAVAVTAILTLVSEVWGCAAGVDDAIKPGKWELSWTAVVPKLQKPPPSVITSVCLPEADLKIPHFHKRLDTTSKGGLGKGFAISIRRLTQPLS